MKRGPCPLAATCPALLGVRAANRFGRDRGHQGKALPDVKRGLEALKISWIEIADAPNGEHGHSQPWDPGRLSAAGVTIAVPGGAAQPRARSRMASGTQASALPRQATC
jgi:hypothetical protein